VSVVFSRSVSSATTRSLSDLSIPITSISRRP
jgi:hypothetical protein